MVSDQILGLFQNVREPTEGTTLKTPQKKLWNLTFFEAVASSNLTIFEPVSEPYYRAKNSKFFKFLEDRVFLRRFSSSERSSDLQFFSHNAKERWQRVNHKRDIHHLGYIRRLVLNLFEHWTFTEVYFSFLLWFYTSGLYEFNFRS